ncbi:hypothetical protein PFY12_00140 [Chryseobacterium camelliae]|uniref:Uncharacterized protein n=1 Tax=Chryseobacterium camelliae TaxID=1265445 RepID=A0ABY7QLH7_9FLAO|nr:hypothetical protein [Chryseobacterium camelliae]WBV60543.1 hypothetical protein PFY12_00140 [Chryseobacterium camelliae]
MEIKEATVEISRHEGGLRSVSVLMPTWDRTEMDGSTSVNIPLFGLKAFVFNKMNQEEVVHDTIKAFCVCAEKHGTGLESELSLLGWEFGDESSENTISMSYVITSKDTVIEQIMSTGETQSMILELA